MEVPIPTFHGVFIPVQYADRSGGTNLRYGKDRILKNRQIFQFRVKDLIVGDVIQLLWVNHYQHGATMQIIKINPKSLKAIEIKGSYAAGRCWTIQTTGQIELYLSIEYTSDNRLQELSKIWNSD
jgi:hypothetical protein